MDSVPTRLLDRQCDEKRREEGKKERRKGGTEKHLFASSGASKIRWLQRHCDPGLKKKKRGKEEDFNEKKPLLLLHSRYSFGMLGSERKKREEERNKEGEKRDESF